MAGTDTVLIDKKHLKPGSNRLIFEFETKSPSMWYLDITAIRFDIEGTEKKSPLVASGESNGIYRWEDYSKPFNTELRFGPKEKIVELNFPEHVLKTRKQIALIIKHSGLGDNYTHFSRSLQLFVNEHATDSGFEFGKNSSFTKDPIQILIETENLKPGTNEFRFKAQSRHYGGYFSIYELYFDLSDIEKSKSMQTNKAPPKEGGERVFKWEDFTQPFKKRIPEIKRMHPATVEVFLPEQLSESDEITLLIDTDLVVGNVFSARLLLNSESEWGAYRFDSSSAENGRIKIMIKTKDLKPALNKMYIKGHRFDIVGIRFELPAALLAQSKTVSSEGERLSAAAGIETRPSGDGGSVEFPKMVVGDAWTLDTAFGLEHYKVIKVNSDGGFIIEKREEKTRITFQLHFDNEYRLIKKLDLEANQRHKIDEPPARYLDFPLYVGKKWEDKYYGWTLSRTRVPREMECSYLVEKMEQIETGAGRINAFKIIRWFRNSSYASIDRESLLVLAKIEIHYKNRPDR